MSLLKPRQIQHLQKFDGGRRTPQEVHAQHAFPPNAKCSGCGGRPSVRGIVMAPFDEAQKRGFLPDGFITPEVAQTIVQINEGGRPRPYIRISMAYSCRNCAKEMEKVLAKAPSWCIVEINRGPDPTNRVVTGYTS